MPSSDSSKPLLRNENTDLIGFVRNFRVFSPPSIQYSQVVSTVFLILGFFFCNISLRSLFSLWSRVSAVYAYPSQGQFSRSQPSIRCFTLAWSKKCRATTMIQVSLQLWPKHCTSVGGPIKVLDSSLWELQPPVKDSSLEQHILKSGLALPSVDSLAFSLSSSNCCSRRACQFISA